MKSVDIAKFDKFIKLNFKDWDWISMNYLELIFYLRTDKHCKISFFQQDLKKKMKASNQWFTHSQGKWSTLTWLLLGKTKEAVWQPNNAKPISPHSDTAVLWSPAYAARAQIQENSQGKKRLPKKNDLR